MKLFGNKTSAVEWLIAGLGNPGQKYEKTRHNMGFLAVDLLAEEKGVKLNKVKFKAAYNLMDFGGAWCLVMKPQTYMNLSGEAVREAAQVYKIPADRVLVIYDDVSLPVGKLRVALEVLHQRHDLRHARFVVRTQQGCPVCDDQILSNIRQKLGELGGV